MTDRSNIDIDGSTDFVRELKPATVVLIYALLGALGLALAIPPGYASPVFPAAGFALAVVLQRGPRSLPWVWLGSLTLNLGVALVHDNLSASAVAVAAGIGSGALLQAWAGAVLVRRWSVSKWARLEQERDIFTFLALGGPVACVVSATCGVLSLVLAGIVQPVTAGYAWWNWYIGDTIGVLLAAPLALGLLGYRDPGWRVRLKSLAVPVVGVLLLAGASFFAVAHWEASSRRAQLDTEGRSLAQALGNRIIAHSEALASLARMIEITPDISQVQFAHFTGTMLRDQPYIFAFSYNPYVRQAERADFERRMGSVPPGGRYRITERDEQKHLVRAGERSEYVAVGYIWPLDGNIPALGFDILADPVRRDAIMRARATGRAAATAPIRLVQESRERPGVLVLAPAYRNLTASADLPDEDALLGFAVAVIKVDEMIDIATRDQLPSGLVLEVSDPAAESGRQLLYRSHDGEDAAADDRAWTTALNVADRTWQLRVWHTREYVEQHRPWLAWGVGVLGLLFVALLQVLLLAVTGRAALIQRRIHEQTDEISAKNEALTMSEERYRSVVDNIKEVFFQTDPRGVWTFLNPAWTEVMGYSVEETLGMPLSDYVHPEDREYCKELFLPLIERSREDCRHVVRYVHKDGSIRWIDVFARLTLDGHGKVVGTSGTLTDITDRRRVEIEIHQAQLKAEAANIAKSRFLATMSHEIRTPMNGILGMAQMLLMPGIDEKVRMSYARTILSSGESLLTLLNDILDLSKVEAGRLELEKSEVIPGQIVGEIEALFTQAANVKGLQIASAWTGPVEQHYLGDPHRLRQMLINLVGNAVKFTKQGAIRIEASEISLDAQVATLEFVVIDSGMGIAQDKQALLFQPFSQIDSSNTRQFGGTGLGLSIVRSLAELMDGEVGVVSEEGQGSRFWFRIKMERVAGTPPPGAGSDTSGHLPALAQSADVVLSGRVLVVEDNNTNRIVIESMLRQLGLTVILAMDGQQGVDRAREDEALDLVLMDLHMPVMDGYSATREIRRLEAEQGAARLPIVALTADAYEEDRQQCLNAGMDDFLAKPIVFSALKSMLGKWLEAVPASPTSDSPPVVPPPQTRSVPQAMVSEILDLLAQNRFDGAQRFRVFSDGMTATSLAARLDEIRFLLEQIRFVEAGEKLRQLAVEQGWIE